MVQQWLAHVGETGSLVVVQSRGCMIKQSQSGAGILKAGCCSFYIGMLKRIVLMLAAGQDK